MAAKERERVAQDVGGPGDGPGAGRASTDPWRASLIQFFGWSNTVNIINQMRTTKHETSHLQTETQLKRKYIPIYRGTRSGRTVRTRKRFWSCHHKLCDMWSVHLDSCEFSKFVEDAHSRLQKESILSTCSSMLGDP